MSKHQKWSFRVAPMGFLALVMAATSSAGAQGPVPAPVPTPPPPSDAPQVGEPPPPGTAPPTGDAQPVPGAAPPTSDAQPAPGDVPPIGDVPPVPAEPAPPPSPVEAAPAEAPPPSPAEVAPPTPPTPVEPGFAAQGQPVSSGEEVVVVTGSRIRDAAGKQAPVLTLSKEDLERTGLVSVGDILQRLPSSGGAINGKSNSSGNFGAPPDGGGVGAGAIEADLRYLGSKRVLVLVDGVRWVNGSAASGVAAATDLNTIPLNMIERIEVLEDGASPVYGSDAIAGVINIITRKELSGASTNAYVGAYHQRDGFTQKYDLTVGNTTKRLQFIAGASFLDQRQVNSKDRSLSNSPIPTLDRCEAGCSSATPDGRVLFTDPVTGESMDLALDRGVSNPSYPGDYHTFGPADTFNFARYNLVLTPSRRISVFNSIVYHLTDQVNLHGKTTFTRRESLNQAAPEPLFIGPEGGNGNRLDRISVDESNPYNPFGFGFDATTNPFVITRRPLEAGPRRFRQTVNTIYVAGGLDGTFDLGRRHFTWDTTVAYGVNRADQRRSNSFNSAKLQQALGPAFLGEDGNYHCGTADNPGDPNCVPFDIFGGQGANGQGSITSSMLDYVTYTQHDISDQRLLDWVANMSGEIAPLPGGPLALGIGVEHRRLKGYFEPDSVVSAGDSADVPAQPMRGSYEVNEAYAEVRAPLLANLPGAALLDLNAAGRVSDYSFLSPELTGKVGGRYKPIDDLVLRGSFGLGFRAPSIGELYGSASRFDAQLSDPCSDFDRPGVTAAVRKRCTELGVPANGSYTQLNPQISVTTGGNEELEPERSKSLNMSVGYSPWFMQEQRWSGSFDLELAFWSIKLDNAVTALNAQLQLDRCVAGDDTQCNGISRTGQGSINGFSNRLQNIGSIETRGLDWSIAYQTPYYPFGRIGARLLSSYLMDYWEKVPSANGYQTVKLEGKVRGEPERAFPQFKSNLVVDYLYEQVSVAVTTRYIHSITEQCRDLADFPGTCSDPNPGDDTLSTNELKPTVYNDLRVLWAPAFDEGLTVTAGVNNVFNVDPPVCYSCSLNGFNGATYDVPGVFGYLSAGYELQ